MAFTDKSWEERNKYANEPAELVFMEYARRKNIHFAKYGFDATPAPMEKYYKLPPLVRGTPDFACVGNEPALVEVKGVGAGDFFSLKDSNLAPMQFWDKICPLTIFIYDNSEHSVALISFEKLTNLLEDNNYDRGQWNDGKRYTKVPKSHLTWTEIDYDRQVLQAAAKARVNKEEERKQG